MHSIEAALTLDYFRRGTNIIVVTLLAMIGFPLWIYANLGFGQLLGPETREGVMLHVTLTLLMGFGAAVVVFQSQGNISRFFARPISAARLATIQLTLGMITIVTMYVVSAAILNLRGAGWPLFGPALFLSATLACALATVWSCEGSVVAQLTGCVATCLPLTLWFTRCYGGKWMGDYRHMWYSPTALEVLTLGGITAAAYVVAILGVNRVRRGDMLQFAALHAWWEKFRATSYTAQSFSSPLRAQIWFESRRSFSILPPCLVALFLLYMLILRAGGWIETAKMLEVMYILPLTVLTGVLPLVFGIVLGNCSHGKIWSTMNHGIATRPVTDRLLATAMLGNAALTLLQTWGVWLLGLTASAGWAYAVSSRDDLVRTFFPATRDLSHWLVPVVGLPLISWTITGLMMSLTATGRQWLWSLALFSGFSLLIAFVLVKDYVSPELFRDLVSGWFLLSGLLALVGTAWAYIAALRKGLVATNTTIAAVAVWFVLSLLLVSLDRPRDISHIPWLVQCWGLVTLSMLPFAALPLAVRWNRHR
ncbi:hypothetical protein NA78x_001599 [Anatilimnocola sp. NA78]|uniref:hypothetical protein n=1 Tax=Anatilimnocola sp. NA78 TaxID=3415683 RepID=UPI003CE46A2B